MLITSRGRKRKVPMLANNVITKEKTYIKAIYKSIVRNIKKVMKSLRCVSNMKSKVEMLLTNKTIVYNNITNDEKNVIYMDIIKMILNISIIKLNNILYIYICIYVGII